MGVDFATVKRGDFLWVGPDITVVLAECREHGLTTTWDDFRRLLVGFQIKVLKTDAEDLTILCERYCGDEMRVCAWFPAGVLHQREAGKADTVKADVVSLLNDLYESRTMVADTVRFLGASDMAEIDSASGFVCSMHSPVLKAMLTSQMQEGCQREIAVQEGFVEAWPEVIRFMYGHEVPIKKFLSFVEFAKIAEYYGMSSLQDGCAASVFAHSWSAIEAVTVIEELGFNATFRSRAWTLLEKCPMELFNSNKWLQCSASFVAEMLEHDLQITEKCAFDAVMKWHTNSGDDRKLDDTALQALLCQLVCFGHMQPSELFACKEVLPMAEYVHCLEVASRAKAPTRVVKRCKHCKSDAGGPSK